jgi:hypothetical protein
VQTERRFPPPFKCLPPTRCQEAVCTGSNPDRGEYRSGHARSSEKCRPRAPNGSRDPRATATRGLRDPLLFEPLTKVIDEKADLHAFASEVLA